MPRIGGAGQGEMGLTGTFGKAGGSFRYIAISDAMDGIAQVLRLKSRGAVVLSYRLAGSLTPTSFGRFYIAGVRKIVGLQALWASRGL
jgi:hypothetical protein